MERPNRKPIVVNAIVRVLENLEHGGSFLEGEGEWLGVVRTVLNDHEFAVAPLPPFRLKKGHRLAMLSSHDWIEVYEVSVSLTEYLLKHIGEEIPRLRVLSALKTPGTVEVVTWNRFPENSSFRGMIDEENSWVSIKWDNGNYSDNTVEMLTQIVVIPLN